MSKSYAILAFPIPCKHFSVAGVLAIMRVILACSFFFMNNGLSKLIETSSPMVILMILITHALPSSRLCKSRIAFHIHALNFFTRLACELFFAKYLGNNSLEGRL
jgi:hypothetical protein